MRYSACVFDAYGTLFDVAGAARAASREPAHAALAEIWPRLAEDWRRKQLEYTWLRTIMGDHADFAEVTAAGLDWAMAAHGLADAALRARLLALYAELPAYPEVPGVLAALRAAGMPCAILSNGTPAMLHSATVSAGIALDAILSVETVGRYKPDAGVYSLATAHFSCAPGQILFVSSNGWDVAGAAHFGFATLWVNRTGLPVDRLPHGPAHVARDLGALAALVAA